MISFFFSWLGLKGAQEEVHTGSGGMEVGRALASGEGAQRVHCLGKHTLEAGFTNSSWDLASNMTAYWTSWEHCIPVQPCLHSAWTAMAHWWTHVDKGIPYCHSGLLWSHLWNLGQCKALLRQPLGLISGEYGVVARRQQFPIAVWQWNYSIFCALLLIKKQPFTLLFVFPGGSIQETCCIQFASLLSWPLLFV